MHCCEPLLAKASVSPGAGLLMKALLASADGKKSMRVTAGSEDAAYVSKAEGQPVACPYVGHYGTHHRQLSRD